MRLLLDTHFVLMVLDPERSSLATEHRRLLQDPRHVILASTASLWEIAIKTRLGKLGLETTLEKLPGQLESADISVLDIRPEHVLTALEPRPPTKDPFDQLLLGVAKAEGASLVTRDAKLASHPLAWKPASA